MTTLYVFWQNPESRRWFPIGILSRTPSGGFEFVYTKGARNASGFVPFGPMIDLSKRYRASDLFPVFANRMLSSKRPEYKRFIQWIAAEKHDNDPLVILSRTGGRRATDTLVVYPKPERNEKDEFDLLFLCHGISHLPKDAADRVCTLKEGDVLYPMLDIRNPHDPNAIALRTDDPAHLIGYVPRFFAKELRVCIEASRPGDARLSVVRVNPDAPLQLRLLCRFTSPWPNGFRPWDEPEYQALVERPVRQGVLEPSAAS
jgi:hypothetical protein